MLQCIHSTYLCIHVAGDDGIHGNELLRDILFLLWLDADWHDHNLHLPVARSTQVFKRRERQTARRYARRPAHFQSGEQYRGEEDHVLQQSRAQALL